jgi:hypothetical protein
METKQNGTSGPQLTWANVFVAIGVICVMVGGAYKIIEVQFDFVKQSSDASFSELSKQIALNRLDIERTRTEYLSLREHNAFQEAIQGTLSGLRARVSVLEVDQKELIGRAAHSPVEAKEVDALSGSVDKRIELLQQQINDINRQIAASVLQNGYPQHPQLLPK